MLEKLIIDRVLKRNATVGSGRSLRILGLCSMRKGNEMANKKKEEVASAGKTRADHEGAKTGATVKKPEFDIKAQRRALQFLNRARSEAELGILAPRRVFEPRDLIPGRLAIHDEPEHEDEKVKFLDTENASRLFRARGEISPVWGFSHLDQVQRLLPDDVFRKFGDVLLTHFSAASFGQWISGGTVTVGGATIVPRHAALLRTGNVLLIEGACGLAQSRTWLWNPFTRTMITPAPASPGNNLYCAGHSFLSDGRLLVAGGGGESNQFPKDRVWLFNPMTSTWDFTRNTATNAQTMMSRERWYPTCVSLGDDRVLIGSGDLNNLGCAPPSPPPMVMEIYNEATGQFSPVTTPADKFFFPTYPGLHLFPSHELFYAPVGFRDNSEIPGACASNEASAILTFSGLNGSWTNTGAQDRTKGMSVLLARQSSPYIQVMIVGGGDAAKSRTYAKIDLSTPGPAWGPDLALPTTAGQPQPTQRIHPNIVLLPDGTVLVCGGADVSEPCWLYDPETLSWTEMDELTFPRRYHSVALLLPTGEVMATGGQTGAGQSEIEVFQPPYLFAGARPTITSVAPDPIHHGQAFTIETPTAADIQKVTLVRPMAVSHQTDSEQRVIPISFTAPGPTTLAATAPSPGHPHGLAPKGYYMLFLINSAGVPSEATFVFLH